MTRIVLFGATGYTGGLTARSLLRLGASPVLAARSAASLEKLASELDGQGEFTTAVADASDSAAVRDLLEPGDVLVSTVGPFIRFGHAAVQAATDVGAHYLDSTGEGPFIRQVFETYGPKAAAKDTTLLTGFGFDFVPGNYAGALAIEDAAGTATAVDVCYVAHSFGTSGGTRTSIAGVMLEDGFAYESGHLRTVRPGHRTRTFTTGKRQASGMAVSATEQYGLPQAYPSLQDVGAYLAVPSAAARVMGLSGIALTPVRRIGPLNSLAAKAAARLIPGSTGGPDAAARAKSSVTVIAEASNGGEVVGKALLRGPDPYDYTADILAWGAVTAAGGGLQSAGACGPVTAFGLDALTKGCADAGLHPVSA